jgi:hypothetical protein
MPFSVVSVVIRGERRAFAVAAGGGPQSVVLRGLHDLCVRRRVVAVERGGGTPRTPFSVNSVISV